MPATPLRLLLPAFGIFLACLSSPLQAAETYSICSWNVENFGVTDRIIDGNRVEIAMKPDKEIASMMAILKRLHPDILGLCEILQDPKDRYVKQVQSELKKAGLDYPHLSTCKGGDSRIQNVLLSRFPILREEPVTDQTFDSTLKDPVTKLKTRQPHKMERGIINSVIEIKPGYQVRVMLVHLKSKRADPGIVSDEAKESGDAFVRRNEALIVKGAMNRVLDADPEARLIVMGDFNDTSRSRAVTTIIGSKDAANRCFDLWLKDWLGDWWTHYHFPEKSYERIDYMVVSKHLFGEWNTSKSCVYRQNQNDPPEYSTYAPSDHRPLLAVFNLPEIPKTD
ncbi:MAG: endonuclease/exonuclease/phosphatase family protein [Methylacidiphilales bacterium]|nr:endonuclease/exonuclease/phosphatase family protein [Candidatus Methylacidiphilales bacterium]